MSHVTPLRRNTSIRLDVTISIRTAFKTAGKISRDSLTEVFGGYGYYPYIRTFDPAALRDRVKQDVVNHR